MRHRGFSTIELLIAISIFLIIAAILFPVFARARDKANQTSCLSNLRQIGTALLMYENEHDGFFPPAGNRDGEEVAPSAALYPYLGSVAVFDCPSVWTEPLIPAGDRSLPLPTDYAFRRDFLGLSIVAGKLACKDYPAIIDLGSSDGLWSWGYLYDENGNLVRSSLTDDSGEEVHLPLLAPHIKGFGLAFLDGHVHWYNASEIEANMGRDWRVNITFANSEDREAIQPVFRIETIPDPGTYQIVDEQDNIRGEMTIR